MTEPFRMHEVALTGTPRDRGRTHGEALRPLIAEVLGFTDDLLANAIDVDPRTLMEGIVRDGGFVAVVERWTPDLLEEVRGIGEGADVPFERIMGFQLIEELGWWAVKRMGAVPSALGCTTLGWFRPGGATILAQTADNPTWINGRQVLLHIDDVDSNTQAHVLTFPGIVGVYGLNDAGIGICINTMVDVMPSTVGLSAPFAARGVLARRSFDEADAFMRSVPHSSGHNFTIGGPGRVVAYECSPNAVVPYIPDACAGISFHTNHPLANEDRIEVEMPEDAVRSTETRFASVEGRMRSARAPFTWSDAREVLSSHDTDDFPICSHFRPDRQSMTCFGIIMECAPEPILHLSSGPPCGTEFRDFDFPAPASA
jgi:hypothetical protein